MKGTEQPTLIVIGGATATGKTALAIRLATHFQTEILSADSRQFYREMTIGTAKPSLDELLAVPHHFINSHAVEDPYSVGDYERDALQLLDILFKKHSVVVLAGGSGLYINALCDGLDRFPEVSQATKDRVQLQSEAGGIEWMQTTLASLDPDYFAKVDPDNPARMRRALEVCLESGVPYSSFLHQPKPIRPFKIIRILLDMPRPLLYDRIDRRVDLMIEAGLESEVRSLVAYRHLNSMRTVGYEEWFEYFEETWTYEETISKIKQHSRNYAKRQSTWFRKYGEWAVFNFDQTDEILTYLANQI